VLLNSDIEPAFLGGKLQVPVLLHLHRITTFTRMAKLCVLVFTTMWVFLPVSIEADIIGVPLKKGGDNEEPVAKSPDNNADDIVGLLDPVMKLNRFTFEQTILKEHDDEVPHWIVIFCAPWYEPCQALEPVFKQLTDKWQNQLNNAVLSTEIRFAAVDCATEKSLCNEQNVDTYPFVAHYSQRKQVKIWKGKSFAADEKRLKDFLMKELVPIAAAQNSGLDEESFDNLSAESGHTVPVDFLLIFAAIAGNAWFISRGGFGGEATSSSAACEKHLHNSDQQVSSCVVRSLPKEWGRDRPSYEL